MALCAGVRILMRSAGPARCAVQKPYGGALPRPGCRASGAGLTPPAGARHRRHRHPPPGAEPATRNPPAAQGRSRRRDRPSEPRDLWKAMGITKRTCGLFRRRLWKARPGPTRARAFSLRGGRFWDRESPFSGCFGTALWRCLPPRRGSASSGSVSGSREEAGGWRRPPNGVPKLLLRPDGRTGAQRRNTAPHGAAGSPLRRACAFAPAGAGKRAAAHRAAQSCLAGLERSDCETGKGRQLAAPGGPSSNLQRDRGWPPVHCSARPATSRRAGAGGAMRGGAADHGRVVPVTARK